MAVLAACGGSDGEGPGAPDVQPGPKDAGAPAPSSLYGRYAGLFPIGAAIMPGAIQSKVSILDSAFNHLTCENHMKFGLIHPEPDRYEFTAADRIANYARDRSITLTGHTFVWHREVPSWLFVDGSGALVGAAELETRLRAHIQTLVDRYDDVVDNWDVANEVLQDASGAYREDSPWFQVFGGPEFIAIAFQAARQALDARGSRAALYYNDYSLEFPNKRAGALAMIDGLRARGIAVDGVGIQGHWTLEWPSLSDIQATLDDFRAAGLKVKISELDVSVYSDDWSNPTQPVFEREKPMTPELKGRQARRFQELFALFERNRDVITSVTTWGIADDETWLDSWPTGRNDHPLLFDDLHQPKDAYHCVLDLQKPC